MQTETESISDENEAIRARLKVVLDRHSKAAIARKTNTSDVNVGRYIRGTQIPAGFLAALVKSLGVNPVWLLQGEGTPFLFDTDQKQKTVELGSEMLQLVEAMTAVSRMKLGAISSSDYAKLLRELDDSLRVHKRVKDKLDARSRPTFKKLLDDLGKAMGDRDLGRAKEIRKVAQRISDFCADGELMSEFAEHQAHLEMRLHKPRAALDYYKQVLLHLVVAGRFPDREGFEKISRYTSLLWAEGRVVDALRTSEAVLALAGEEARQWPEWAVVIINNAEALLELGQLDEAMARLHRSISRLAGDRQVKAKATLVKGLLYSESIGIQEAIKMDPHDAAKDNGLVYFAEWLEDADSLEAVLGYAGRADGTESRKGAPVFPYEELLLMALRDPKGKRVRQAEEALGSDLETFHTPRWTFRKLVLEAQYARVIGDTRTARSRMKHADELLQSMDPGESTHLMARAVHYRTVLELIGKTAKGDNAQLRDRACMFFNTHTKAGFGCFRRMLPLMGDSGR